MNYRGYGYKPKRKPQKFNKNITFVMKGEKIRIQDYINEHATGLDFYENLERIGSVQGTIDYMKQNGAAIYGDFSEAITLENLEQKRNALLNVWKKLPYTEKAKFENNFEVFITNGKEYMTNLKNSMIRSIINEEQRNNNAPIPTDESNKGTETKQS